MSSVTPVYRFPSLSEQGWVEDGLSILNNLFICYLLTDGGQSLVFGDNLTSLPVAYHLHINNPEAMAARVTSDLQSLLGRHFPQAEASARAVEITLKHYAILMSAVVITDKGEQLQLSKIMEISSENLRKVIDVSNYGEGERVLSDLAQQFRSQS